MGSERKRRAARLSATVLALLALLAAATHAQQAPGSGGAAARAQKVEQRIEARANMHAQNLGLTPEQTKDLVRINREALQQLERLQASPTANGVTTAKTLRSILDTRRAALGKLFTPEQMRKYTATNQRDGASLMTLSVAEAIPLTDDEMRRLDAIHLTYLQKVSAALSQGDRSTTIGALKAAQKDLDRDLEKTLTPDQWKRYQELIPTAKEKPQP
jgi:hypothetical protein